MKDEQTAPTNHHRAGNEAFSRNLLLWTFQQRGVLRAQHVHFAKTGEDRAPEDGFRIMDDVVGCKFPFPVQRLGGVGKGNDSSTFQAHVFCLSDTIYLYLCVCMCFCVGG